MKGEHPNLKPPQKRARRMVSRTDGIHVDGHLRRYELRRGCLGAGFWLGLGFRGFGFRGGQGGKGRG